LADEELRHHSEGDGDLGLFALFLRISPTLSSLSHIDVNGSGGSSPPPGEL
jgi:hypothetical protein